MGKSNRIRAERANQSMSAPRVSKRNNKKGLSSKAMSIIALAVTIAILLMVVAFVLIGNGVLNRWKKAAESENFSVNANMMSYYFYSIYSNFTNEYSDYMSYLSLDTSKSLKEQEFGGAYDTSLLEVPEGFSGTWFDFFANQASSDVYKMLLYLEEANARGLSLTDEEKDEITETLKTTAEYYGYTGRNLNTYFSLQYGKGVAMKDVQKAIEYSTLAGKAQTAIYEEYEAWLKANPSEIDSKYESNKKDFDVVDFIYHTFTVSYDEIAKRELGDSYQTLLKDNEANQKKVLDAYKAEIAEAQAKANELSKITDETKLKGAILNIVLGDAYDSTYTTELDKVAATELLALFDLGKTYDEAYAAEGADAAKGALTSDDLSAIKNGMVKELISNALAGDEEDAANAIIINTEKTSATAYGKTVPVAFAEALEKVRATVETSANAELSQVRSLMIQETVEKALADKNATSDEEKADTIEIKEETQKDANGNDVKVKVATVYGKSVPVACAEALKNIRNSLDTKATSALSTAVQNNLSFGSSYEDDKSAEWLMADGRAAGDSTVITEGDGALEEIISKDGYTYVSAFLMKNPAHKNEDPSRNVAYAVFQTETNAINAISALIAKENLDVTAFEEIVRANSSAEFSTIDNCRPGQTSSDAFDAWLFDEDLAVGSYTLAPLSLDSSTWLVAFYTSEGEPTWRMTVSDSIMTEKQNAKYDDMVSLYGGSIEVHNNVINKIKA